MRAWCTIPRAGTTVAGNRMEGFFSQKILTKTIFIFTFLEQEISVDLNNVVFHWELEA